MALGEFDLIARYFQRPVARAALGIGDDCALLAPAPGQQIAVSCDMLVEGRHFLSTVPPERLVDWRARDGWEPICRALGVSVPDEPFPWSNRREDWR
jgi:thiamine-monophosphate kinase